MMSDALYRDFNSYLRRLYGCRVQKIIVDAGLTCPNRDGTLGHGGCIYCNARGSGSGAALHSMSITDQLAAGKSYLARRYKAKKFLAYFQSFTNTYAPFAVLKELYAEALSVPDVVGLTIGTRPDCVSDEVLDHLHVIGKRHLVWLEYGLQSAHDKTLALINRGHNVEAFSNAVERTRRRGIPVCAHVILGLPGESREDMMETARFLAATDLQALKIHLLYVIRGTELETWFRAGKYECLTRADYAATVSDFLALLPPHLIIQRVTGDPHPKELISPFWALEKQKTLHAIHEYMQTNGLFQGKNFIPCKRKPRHSTFIDT